jgi:hypothetical protein
MLLLLVGDLMLVCCKKFLETCLVQRMFYGSRITWILKANVHRQVVFFHSLVGPRKKNMSHHLQMPICDIFHFSLFPFRSMLLYIVSLLVLFLFKNIYTFEKSRVPYRTVNPFNCLLFLYLQTWQLV